MSGFLKMIVAVSLIVLMFIGFWVVRYQPEQNEIASLNAEIQQQETQYQQLQAESQNLEKWEQAKTAFEQVIAKLHQTAVPVKNFIPSFLKDIEQLVENEKRAAADPTFKITSITPGAPQSGAPASSSSAGSSDQEKALVQLNFTGRFNTLVDFLQQLSNLKLNKLVTIQQLSLTPSGSTEGGSPTLTINMPFQIYMVGGG